MLKDCTEVEKGYFFAPYVPKHTLPVEFKARGKKKTQPSDPFPHLPYEQDPYHPYNNL